MTPPAESEQLTVGEALAELREMFPNVPEGRFSVHRHESWFLVGRNGLVWAVHADALMRQGPTLADAMDQVRKWHKDQQ